MITNLYQVKCELVDHMARLTTNEVDVYKQWFLDKKNKEMAEELELSKDRINQTIKKINDEISSAKDSLALLEQMGIVDPIIPLKLTEKGRSSVLKRLSEMQSSRGLESRRKLSR